MLSLGTLTAFALVSLGMVCSPGPNMIYLISRTITQGRMAGVISLCGVMLGFVVYILATMFGLTAIFTTVPVAYEMIKWAGAAYLLHLAWKAIKPGGESVLQARTLAVEPPRKLFLMGFMTNLLNPKIAVLYVSLLPQFQDPAHGSLFVQSSILGLTQITISFLVNLLIVLTAHRVASLLGARPTWIKVQKWMMASVLTVLAARMALDRR
ncbi:LysE family translocator [Brevibacillus choshinensis]|uniref:LysE family translocator n=1 Tax=Brevibacillus choshinensis TaxID=54911 RepID=A0ABX7FTS6_BRECH|nr:LysE family translocator [Brevibacillus choshinensis]QRG69113.1 LysE family translocator [Brevibacillus choshinensis]